MFGAVHAAALLAVVLLSFASVRSIVMEAASATPAGMWPLCSAARHGSATDKTTHAICGFCATAGHAPLTSEAPPLARPHVVVWSVKPPPAVIGPRGPPAVRARARSPPSDLQSA